MAFHTAMIPPPGSGGPRDEIERARLVPDTFSWAAFLLTGLWLLGQRLWLATILFLLAWGALFYSRAALGLGGRELLLIYLAIGFFLGLEGRNLIVRKLVRQGWRLADVVEARSLPEAERRYFERALAGQTPPVAREAVPQGGAIAAPLPVIGLFPETGGAGGYGTRGYGA